LYVEITAGDPAVRLPRTKIGAVPYAVEAERASNAAGALERRLAEFATRIAMLEAAPAPIVSTISVQVPASAAFYTDCMGSSGTFPQGACARMAYHHCRDTLGHTRGGFFQGDLQGALPIAVCFE
jgi:hypothetical protein